MERIPGFAFNDYLRQSEMVSEGQSFVSKQGQGPMPGSCKPPHHQGGRPYGDSFLSNSQSVNSILGNPPLQSALNKNVVKSHSTGLDAKFFKILCWSTYGGLGSTPN
jgi:hypothetical protein